MLIGVPLVTQSDRGRENNGIANMHTTLRHRLDPSLCDTLQHRWCIDKSNIKAEALWSQLRRYFTPGFESTLDYGLINGLYDPNDPLEKYKLNFLYTGMSDLNFSGSFSVGLRSHGSRLNLINGLNVGTQVPGVLISTRYCRKVSPT